MVPRVNNGRSGGCLYPPFDRLQIRPVPRFVACYAELAIVAMPSAGRNMGIAGNLATMSVVDLLQFLETGQKSGVLRVSRESVTKEIFLEKVFIIGSISTDPKEYFSQFLLHYGKIDEPQLRLA